MDDTELLADLTRVKAIFQARSIVAAMGIFPMFDGTAETAKIDLSGMAQPAPALSDVLSVRSHSNGVAQP